MADTSTEGVITVSPGMELRSRLLGLYGEEGPFLTVYVETPSRFTDADEQLSIRWRNLRRVAAEQGASDELLDVAERTIEGNHQGGDGLVVVVDERAPRLVVHIADQLTDDVAYVGELPRLAPLLDWESSLLPHVVVLTDRVGADVSVVDQGELEDSFSIEGETLHIHRSHPGGWSQRRYQQRAENTWEANSVAVAEAVAKAADSCNAAFIAVAGDVRATQFLTDSLPERLRALVHQVPGGRQPGDDLDGTAEAVIGLQDTIVAKRMVALLETFRDSMASGRGVEGVEETMRALSEGRVSHLLVSDDVSRGNEVRMAWVGDGPMVAPTDEAVANFGQTPRRAPLVDACIRSAVAQGAEVTVVPYPSSASPIDGLGGLVRNQ